MSIDQEDGYIPVVSTSQMKAGSRLIVEIGGKAFILFRVGDDYYAIQNICSHEYQTLDESELDGYEITCPKHGAKFDIRNGNALTLPAVEKIQSVPVRVVDGMVEIMV